MGSFPPFIRAHYLHTLQRIQPTVEQYELSHAQSYVGDVSLFLQQAYLKLDLLQQLILWYSKDLQELLQHQETVLLQQTTSTQANG